MRERRAIIVTGIVQGVGFRPFVHGVAARLGLGGFVRNLASGVRIEIEGESHLLDRFEDALASEAPAPARIERTQREDQPVRGDARFHIEPSTIGEPVNPRIAADAATCSQCLAELFDPRDRRHGYPFLNCARCGPRLTIITGVPYDRARTTMAGFSMCPRCQAEYNDPRDRRYHAQATACAECGPRLELCDQNGGRCATDDPIARVVAELTAGKIVAIKGLGGYHLACDPRNESAVAALRSRKFREEKPFAVMVDNCARARELCEVDAAAIRLLESPRRPIVLLMKRPEIALARGVAPGNPRLGIMLPYTPLHHLILASMPGSALVMTSGNRADEPIACTDADAFERLGGIADWFLVHDRPIHVRCDDSVTRIVDGRELPIRRSRGDAPLPIPLAQECPEPILAVGGELKSTFALGLGATAILSHHLGDLEHLLAYNAFERDVALYEQLFAFAPRVIAHDMHPDYASTRYAREKAAEQGVALVPVQHHHAHMASALVEHQLAGPVIGVTFDGAGYGLDGTIWGGEFLVGDALSFRRQAHLRAVPMPGGDRAAREPWRMALAYLHDAGCAPATIAARIDPLAFRAVRGMLERSVSMPVTSSAGRLFDAAAAIAGVRDVARYEGQAAIELEWLAERAAGDGAYPFAIDARGQAESAEDTMIIDTRPLIRALAADVEEGVPRECLARRFHATLAGIIVDVCERIRAAAGIDVVVLTGGVFMNAWLASAAAGTLKSHGFAVYCHERVPPNDGGLCLGQVAVAAAMLSRRRAGLARLLAQGGPGDVPGCSGKSRGDLPRA